MRRWFSCRLLCWLWFLPLVVLGDSALSYLNDLRTHTGLQPLHHNKALTKAAKAHAKYALRVQRYSHHERKSTSGFTGKTAADRAILAGYSSRFVMENIAVNTNNTKSTVETLLSAIYHRFLFLSFDIDEIGQGDASTRKKRAIQQVHVFDMGASTMGKICKEEHKIAQGTYYLTDLCQDRDKRIPLSRYRYAKNSLRKHNNKIILYPYVHQKDVPPAFYNETPDPMPGYKVSGFPISVQFNPYYYHKTKLLSFKLYNAKGKELKSRILNHRNDQNKKLEPNEYALMPLKRLEYAMRYKVYLSALVDGKRIERTWSFVTRKPAAKLYRISKTKAKIKIGNAKKIWLYFVPRDKKDILQKVRHSKGIKIRFIDQNTLEVTFLGSRRDKGYRVVSGDREVRF